MSSAKDGDAQADAEDAVSCLDRWATATERARSSFSCAQREALQLFLREQLGSDDFSALTQRSSLAHPHSDLGHFDVWRVMALSAEKSATLVGWYVNNH